MTFVLETRRLTKRFAGVAALQDVDFRVRPGEIHALIGLNGAGKSTLVKVLNGVYGVGEYEGEVRLGGAPVAFSSPADARERGISYVPQEIQVLENVSVGENVFVGRMGLDGGPLVHYRDVHRRATELLDELAIPLSARSAVGTLSAAQRHLVMVARALASTPSVLMLDEPTASLSQSEADHLFAVLERLHARGLTIVFISHRLREIMALCDRASVLRDGQLVDEIERAEFSEERLVAAMVGRRIGHLYPERAGRPGKDVALSVRGLRVPRPQGGADIVSDVSFELRQGEILGLAGLVGSGRTETLGAIYGRLKHEGEIVAGGKRLRSRGPASARRAGVALLTENRKQEGLLFNFSLERNITIGNLRFVSGHGVLKRGQERVEALSYMRELQIKARSASSDVAHLSGGNQQKVLFARALMSAPRILLLDEPTKGVDVETKQQIYRLIVELADAGASLLVVSSELPELLGICDRCVVLAAGRIVDEFGRGEGSEQRVVEVSARAGGSPEARAVALEAEAVDPAGEPV
jgi:ABC-type sugar transport system ATPase subunit